MALAAAGLDAVYSYAGRTKSPTSLAIPHRSGGFGGVAGLISYMQTESITHIVDATHPFAVEMSRNAVDASAVTSVPLIALERAAWVGEGWTHVRDTEAAVQALPAESTRVFLAIGRQNLLPFAAKPQHHYLLRLVDQPTFPLPLLSYEAVIARGPFTVAGDLELLKIHGIQYLVAKNSGGAGAHAKLDAARTLGLPVILIDRPAIPLRQSVETVAQVMDWIDHATLRGV